MQVSILNRYGNKTKTTGILNIKWNVVRQRDVGENVKEISVHKNKRINRRHVAIANVLDAYREARERLEDIIN